MAKNLITHEDVCIQCLCCQFECSMVKQKEYNPSKSYIKLIYDEDFLTKGYEFMEECDVCGVCVKACPVGALELVK